MQGAVGRGQDAPRPAPPGATTPGGGGRLAPSCLGGRAFLTPPIGHLPALQQPPSSPPCPSSSPLPASSPQLSLVPPGPLGAPSVCPPSLPPRPLHGPLLSPPGPCGLPGSAAWFPRASGTLCGAHSDPDQLGTPVSIPTVEGPGGPMPSQPACDRQGPMYRIVGASAGLRALWAGTLEALQSGPRGQRDRLPAQVVPRVYSNVLYFEGK